MAKAEKTSTEILLEQLKKNMKNEISEQESTAKPSSNKKEREFDDMLKQYFSNVSESTEHSALAEEKIEEPKEVLADVQPEEEDDGRVPWDEPEEEVVEEQPEEEVIDEQPEEEVIDEQPEEEVVDEQPEEEVIEEQPEEEVVEEQPEEEVVEEQPEEEVVDEQPDEEVIEEQPEDEVIEEQPEEEVIDEQPEEEIIEEKPEREVFKYYAPQKPVYEAPKITDNYQGTPDSEYGNNVISSVSTEENKTLSDGDILELLDLGYEDELKRIYGATVVRAFKRRKSLKTDMDYIEKTTGESADPDGNFIGMKPGDKELINQAEDQRERVYAKYVAEVSSYGMKFVVAGIIALILLVYDNIMLFIGNSTGPIAEFMRTPYSPLLGLMILSASMAVLWKILAPSVIKLLKGQPNAYSVLLMNVIPTAIYDMVLMFMPWQAYPMFNYLAAISLLLAAVCSYLELKSRLNTINVATSDEEKYLLGRYFQYNTIPVSGGRLSGDKVRIDYAVFKSAHVEGLIRKMDKPSSSRMAVLLVPIVVLMTSGAVAAVGAFSGYSFIQTLCLFMTGIYWLMPFSFAVYLIVPKSLISRAMAKRKCAIIGDASAELYAAGHKICFKDNTFVKPCEPVKFRAMPGEPLRNDEIEMIRDMFRTIGGTVEEMAGPREKFTQSTVNSMRMIEVSRDGFTASVNMGVEITVGLYSYMIHTNSAVQIISAAEADKNIRNSSTVYVSINGHLKYRYTPEFEQTKQYKYIKSQLAVTDVKYAVRSYNPSVNGELFKKLGCGEPEIVRPKEFNMDFDNSVGESGIIASGNEAAVLFPMNACREIVKNRKNAWTVGIICYAVALVLLVLNTLFGKPDTFNSLIITAFACLQCIPVIPAAIKMMAFQRRHSNLKKSKNKKES